MELVNQFIFIGALLILLSIMAGEDGLLGIPFSDYRSTFAVGSIALAIILFEGGLRTPREVVRLVFWPSLTLATVGVLLTALCMAGMAVLVMGMHPLEGILMGAILASTDAAAVFMLLHGQGVAVNA